MSRGAVAAVAMVLLSLFAGLIALVLPLVGPQGLAEPFLDVDAAEGKVNLDSKVVLEVRGSYSKGEVLDALRIHPAVPLAEEDVDVERVARFPWLERAPWAKTRVVINQKAFRTFDPETRYAVELEDTAVTFETITVPRVVSARPEDPAADPDSLPTSGAVVLRFNEVVSWRDRHLDVEPSVPVTVTSRTVEGATELRVAPEQRWDNLTTYTLTVGEGVRDVYGHSSEEEFSYAFTTWPRPNAVTVSPYGGDLPVDSTVRVEFERPVDRAAVEKAFTIRPAASGTFEWKSDSLLKWQPSQLEYGTTYEVFVGGEAAGGDPLVGTGWTFSTRSQPEVVMAEPAGGSLPLDTPITVVFDRPVKRKSVEKAIRIEPAAEGKFSWQDRRSVTWTPEGLAYSTAYTVSVGGRSLDGDPIVPREWTFETHDPPVDVSITGDERSPTTLVAEAGGGTGDYSYEWSTGDTGREISVDLWYGETETFTVRVVSGDQAAEARATVHGPPSPCPPEWKVISEEVCYREETLEGPVRTFVARVDLADPDVQVGVGLSGERLGRVRTVGRSASDRNTIVSINGDFAGPTDHGYLTLGPMLSNGNLIYAPDHPGYGPDLPGAVLALGRDGSSWVGPEGDLRLSLTAGEEDGDDISLEHVNSVPDQGQLALFNTYWGEELSLEMEGCYARFVPDEGGAAWASDVSCGAIKDVALAEGEFVLVGRGSAAGWLNQHAGERLSLETSFPLEQVDLAIGGSHALIRDGELPALSPYLGGMNPRTAIGVDDEGFLYLVVVDGRSKASAGMTLAQLQNYLRGLGIVSALNLDGGGSSTMVLEGSLMNVPSDGRQRAIAAVVEVTQPREPCENLLVRCRRDVTSP